ncbi:type II-A CRISPR-associated protein Csn2 [Mogibacterium neglectum]|uniref:type II-A CRISPR-associated protein Csn2 n=1 Tax=Mogibacterium neglectum TaxID=114528 RepID=UPI00272CE3E3|nr:type II-A CRISPR-associated protein Csn2 [Mogibacterium neglectum]
MKLVIKSCNLIVDLEENIIDIFVIENPRVMTSVILDTINNSKLDSKIILIENDGEDIPSSKYEFITSPFTISLNSKKLLGSALKDIEASICENYYDKFQEINTDILNLLDQAILDLPYDVSFDCIKEIKDIIKACDISFEEKQLSLLEKITDYIKLESKILKLKCIIFVNIHDFLDDDEIQLLYKEAFYQKVQIIMIESHEINKKTCERVHVIDQSQCIIEY